MDPLPSVVKSADRVLDLFELLASSGQQMSHSDIADALDIPKSSLTQLLKTLIARGYVSVTRNGRGYTLGDTLLDLSHNAGLLRDLVSLAEPFLAEITAQTRESSALNQLKGSMSEVVATVLGPHRLVTHMRLGDVAPLYATSGGKALLAHFPPAAQEDYLAKVGFEAFTPRTIGTSQALLAELEEVRATGFAHSYQEFTPGIVGIARVLLNEAGVPLGSINIAVPATRFDRPFAVKAEEILRKQVDSLQRQLLQAWRPRGAETARSQP